MRITCPACEATYEVPARLLGAARQLRCAKCKHLWQPAIEEAEPVAAPERVVLPPVAPVAPPPPPLREVPPPTPAARRSPELIEPPLPMLQDRPPASRGIYAAWAVSLALVAGIGTGLWLYRADVVEAWPPAARLFAALGASV